MEPGLGPRVTVLTGVTGFLGRELLQQMLARNPEEHVIVLVRPSRGRSAADRLADLLQRVYADPEARSDAERRVQAVEADLTRENPDLAETITRRVEGHRSRVIHGAASVAFDLPIKKAREVNVEGTRRMLTLAEGMARVSEFEGFGYISTAFVAGERSGTVFERELDVGQSFTNTYEQSKCEAEKLVGSYQDRLPIRIFRPSIVAGHSSSGETSSFKVLYWPLKAFARRLVLCIPGDPESCYDIVPVDFVAEALLHIAERQDSSGGCYHLTSGRTFTLQRAVDLAAEFFEVRRIPPFVSPRRFYAFIRPILFVTLIGPARRVLTTGDLYIPYLSKKLVFDNQNTMAALEGSGLKVPDVESYLKTVYHYAKETDFGKRQSS